MTETVAGTGPIAVAASTVDHVLAAPDGQLFTLASREVPALAAGATSTATTTVTVPSDLPPHPSFELQVCADSRDAVAETDEADNCRVAGSIVIGQPDLRAPVVSDPPAEVVAGGSFPVTSTTANDGRISAEASRTRFWLSTDQVRGPGDRLLTGAALIGALAPGGVDHVDAAADGPDRDTDGAVLRPRLR